MQINTLPKSWVRANWPAPDNIVAFTTSRQALKCDSSNEYLSNYQAFNLALHVGDNESDVIKNRNELAALCSLQAESFCWLDQVHSNIVVEASSTTSQIQADASHVGEKGKACVVMTADCLPVLFSNKQGTHVAAAHAGWRGLASGVLANTVSEFAHSDEILAWLGPAISQKAFEVGQDVFQAFNDRNPASAKAFIPATEPNKWYADLYQLARTELKSIGVTEVYGGEHCSFTEEELFYSYRRDGAVSGRMASVIYIR